MKAIARLWLIWASMALLPAVVQALDFTYTDNGDGTCTITKYTGSGGAVTVPGMIDGLTVTGIGKFAFEDCTGLTSITIPDSVTAIGDLAFVRCFNLTSITIPEGVTSIGDGAFCGCTNLASVMIGNGVTSIGGLAFYRCTGLTSVTIPDSVTSIGGRTFDHCTSLKGAYFKGNAPTLGGSDVFCDDSDATVYYLPGTTGWGSTFGGRPTAMWRP